MLQKRAKSPESHPLSRIPRHRLHSRELMADYRPPRGRLRRARGVIDATSAGSASKVRLSTSRKAARLPPTRFATMKTHWVEWNVDVGEDSAISRVPAATTPAASSLWSTWVMPARALLSDFGGGFLCPLPAENRDGRRIASLAAALFRSARYEPGSTIGSSAGCRPAEVASHTW